MILKICPICLTLNLSPLGEHPPEHRPMQLQIQSTMMCKPSARRCLSKWWRHWRWLMVKKTSSLLGKLRFWSVDVLFCLSGFVQSTASCSIIATEQFCVWVGPSSWWPDLSEGEWERLGLDGLWRETDHLEDLPDCRGQGTVTNLETKSCKVAKQGRTFQCRDLIIWWKRNFAKNPPTKVWSFTTVPAGPPSQELFTCLTLMIII